MDVCRFRRGVFCVCVCGHDTSTDDSVPIYAMMCMPYIAVLALRVKRPKIFSVNMTSAPWSWPRRPSQHRFDGRCCGLLRLQPVPSGIDTRVVLTCWTACTWRIKVPNDICTVLLIIRKLADVVKQINATRSLWFIEQNRCAICSLTICSKITRLIWPTKTS